MIFNPEVFELNDVYEVSKLRIHFDSVLEVSIKSYGFIEENRLICPCEKTKLKVSTIFKYQEENYIINYKDEFLEDIYILIDIYNKKLEIEHSQKHFLAMKPIKKPLEYVLFKMRRNPKKYGAFLKDAKLYNNPFNNANEEREKKLNISSADYIEQMKQEEMAKSNKVTWEEMENTKAYIYSYLMEYIQIFSYISFYQSLYLTLF